MEVTRGPRRRPRRNFASRLETLEARALLNATIDVDADGRLAFKSDPAVASALRVSHDGGVYTFDLGAAGPDIVVASNAAGLAVTGSGTRTVTVAGPSALQIVAQADSDSILLASSDVPVVALLQARDVTLTVGDQTDARGLDAVLVTPRCADPLYRRSVRVSMGTVFQVPWTRIDPWPDGVKSLQAMGFTVAALALADDAVTLDELASDPPDRLAIVLGTEGHGLSDRTVSSCDVVVRIPMSGGVDSLNVAAASAVAFWALRQPYSADS